MVAWSSDSNDIRRHLTLIYFKEKNSCENYQRIWSKLTFVLFKWTNSCLPSKGRTTLIGFAMILFDGDLEKLADPQRV